MPKFATLSAGPVLAAICALWAAAPLARAEDAAVLREVRFPHSPGEYARLGPVGPYYPERAERNGVTGSVAIACHVAADGALNDCVVAKEVGDWNFGDASLAMAKKRWIMAKPKADGSPEDPSVLQYFRVDFGPSRH